VAVPAAVAPPLPRIKVGILTVSDRASSGEYEDRGGPAIRTFVEAHLANPRDVIYQVVPDERAAIGAGIRSMATAYGCVLILTTGGTGPAARDVTPEATAEVCEKLMSGFGERMRAVGVANGVPSAILSRGVAGVCGGGALVVNLPGNPAAVAECLGAVWGAVGHCVRVIGGPIMTMKGVEAGKGGACGCGGKH